MYMGVNYYLLCYAIAISIQLTLYEILVGVAKKRPDFKEKEIRYITGSSLIAAAISAIMTNSFEVMTLNKQINPGINMYKDLIKKEGSRLLTRGIGARTVYTCLYSLVFFNAANFYGKIFGVSLTEDEAPI